MVSCYAQIINDYVLGYKIPELVKHEKIKARKLSYDSQVYLLMLGQFLHVFSLNELVDISKIYAKELSRIRGISPANLNTFSNANRTRNPSVMEKFFWMMYDHFKSQDETFIKAKHKGMPFQIAIAPFPGIVQHLRFRSKLFTHLQPNERNRASGRHRHDILQNTHVRTTVNGNVRCQSKLDR